MRLGIVPNLYRSGGGIYQYSATLLASLPDAMAPDDELVIFLYGGEALPPEVDASRFSVVELRAVSGLRGAVWYPLQKILPVRVADGLRRWLKKRAASRSRALGGIGDSQSAEEDPSLAAGTASLVDRAWSAFFARHAVDLLLFTTDSDLAFRSGVPYAVAIHDIQHRLQPEFQEVSADGEWERREFVIGNCVRNASVVLVDSDVGKQDVVAAYEVSEEAVVVVPFLPAGYLRPVEEERVAEVRATLGLPHRFLFYPAAFWPHKNHARILRALALLRETGLDVPLVLVGPHSGARREEVFAELMLLAHSLGVADLVRYLGYVDDDMMSALYQAAIALVMPTFFGPTNIPPIEAFKLGCPVITSDIRGIREQVADAAVLVDPTSHEAIAEGIRRVVTDAGLRAQLVRNGRRRLEGYSAEEFGALVRQAVTRAAERSQQR